jgi:hypothetical protein
MCFIVFTGPVSLPSKFIFIFLAGAGFGGYLTAMYDLWKTLK